MKYTIDKLLAMDPAAIARLATPRHIQSVIEDMLSDLIDAQHRSEEQARVVGDPVADMLECLAIDIEAIGVMYQGDPSYEHDAYWMRENAAKAVRDLASRLASPPAPQEAQAGMVLVPLEFVQGFHTLAHNYSLQAIAPDYYHGVERDAFKDAYARCGSDLAKLRAIAMFAAPVAQPATEQAEAPSFNLDPTPISGWGQQPIGMGTLGTFEHRCPAVTGHRGGVFVCQSAGHGVSQNSYCDGCTCPAAIATQPTASNAGELRTKIDKAAAVVAALCDGSQRWTMSVPARPDSDPDLVIMDALSSTRAALASKPVAPPARGRDFHAAKAAWIAEPEWNNPLQAYDRGWYDCSVLSATTPAPAGQIEQDAADYKWLVTVLVSGDDAPAALEHAFEHFGPDHIPTYDEFTAAIRAARGDEVNQK